MFFLFFFNIFFIFIFLFNFLFLLVILLFNWFSLCCWFWRGQGIWCVCGIKHPSQRPTPLARYLRTRPEHSKSAIVASELVVLSLRLHVSCAREFALCVAREVHPEARWVRNRFNARDSLVTATPRQYARQGEVRFIYEFVRERLPFHLDRRHNCRRMGCCLWRQVGPRRWMLWVCLP